MFVKQLSVFIENREGRLEQVTEAIKSSNVNIVSLSLSDTTEYGLLRMIVSDPEKAKDALQEKGFSAMLTDVLAVKLAYEVGKLQEMLVAVSGAGLNIEYMYALATAKDEASIVVKVSDPEKAVEVLKEHNIDVYRAEEAYALNR